MNPAKIILLACVASLVIPAAVGATDIPVPPQGASSRIDAIRQRGTLRVAVLNEYPWLVQNSANSSAPFHGPAWTLANEYARRLGVKIETTPVTFDNKVSILAVGSVDVSIAPLLSTPQRAAVVDMILYSASAHCLFGLADNPKIATAERLDDLNRPGVTIGFIADTPQGAWLQKRLSRTARDSIPGNLTDLATAEILARRADVAPIDKFFFPGLQRRVPGLVSVPRNCLVSQELPIPIGMAIDKQQPVLLNWMRAVEGSIHREVDSAMAQSVEAGH